LENILKRTSSVSVRQHGSDEKYKLEYRCGLYNYNIIQYCYLFNLKASKWEKNKYKLKNELSACINWFEDETKKIDII